MVESRTGMNVFNHLDRLIPILRAGGEGEPEAFTKFGAASCASSAPRSTQSRSALRSWCSLHLRSISRSESPAAVECMHDPVGRRLRGHRFWDRRADAGRRRNRLSLVAPPRGTTLWPVIIPALIVIKLVLPGTLGAIKQSFLPAGGLIAEQNRSPARAAAADRGHRACSEGMEAPATARPGLRHQGRGREHRGPRRTSWTTSGSGRCSRRASSASSAGCGSSSES